MSILFHFCVNRFQFIPSRNILHNKNHVQRFTVFNLLPYTVLIFFNIVELKAIMYLIQYIHSTLLKCFIWIIKHFYFLELLFIHFYLPLICFNAPRNLFRFTISNPRTAKVIAILKTKFLYSATPKKPLTIKPTKIKNNPL